VFFKGKNPMLSSKIVDSSFLGSGFPIRASTHPLLFAENRF